MRKNISTKEIKSFYELQGESGDHQKGMYESGNTFYRWFQNRRRTVVESLIKQCNASTLLDVGCAEGLFIRFLSKDREYSVGVDISKPKLMRAKAYGNNHDSSFILTDASCLPFRDSSFDMVICIDVLRYLINLDKAISELFRVSKKYVIIQSATDPRKIFSSEIIQRDYSKIKKDFMLNPFDGELWFISSRALIRFNRHSDKDFKCSKIIGHFQLFIALAYRAIPFKNNEKILRKFIWIIEKIDNSLSTNRFFYHLGIFTTVLFKRENLR